MLGGQGLRWERQAAMHIEHEHTVRADMTVDQRRLRSLPTRRFLSATMLASYYPPLFGEYHVLGFSPLRASHENQP